jgi:hypothetical protein
MMARRRKGGRRAGMKVGRKSLARGAQLKGEKEEGGWKEKEISSLKLLGGGREKGGGRGLERKTQGGETGEGGVGDMYSRWRRDRSCLNRKSRIWDKGEGIKVKWDWGLRGK